MIYQNFGMPRSKRKVSCDGPRAQQLSASTDGQRQTLGTLWNCWLRATAHRIKNRGWAGLRYEGQALVHTTRSWPEKEEGRVRAGRGGEGEGERTRAPTPMQQRGRGRGEERGAPQPTQNPSTKKKCILSSRPYAEIRESKRAREQEQERTGRRYAPCARFTICCYPGRLDHVDIGSEASFWSADKTPVRT